MSHDDKLVYMANQIGKFFAAQGEAKAVPAIAAHLRRYWDPSMRSAILARAASGEACGLDPWTLAAVRTLAAPQAVPHASPEAVAAGLGASESARV